MMTTKSIINTLISLGYNFVQIQTGKDFTKVSIDPDISPAPKIITENSSTVVDFDGKLKIKYDPYFENFVNEIQSSDLIISHAGAGTCLEVLRQKRPLIVVINEDLMDNHQTELAEQLCNDGYLYYSICDTLCEVLQKDLSKLKPYPEPDKFLFCQIFG
ncbi:hypothetical protein NQ317_018098 [Molorchus minor]|uniref:UDP-N-acetylglucosamine transferase subunit ALG13 n=1 Tax=Molorchus minor TaxID=1323400 RepID=A0ABQ9J991_9CUCU|nr:hypothetical protein NQ317_018098 [Molorchus minor]